MRRQQERVIFVGSIVDGIVEDLIVGGEPRSFAGVWFGRVHQE